MLKKNANHSLKVGLITALFVIPTLAMNLFASESMPVQQVESNRDTALRSADGRKIIKAMRVPNGAIQMDGIPNESVWTPEIFVKGFLQKEPNEGAQPNDSMEVAVVYDDVALYITARMYCPDPTKLRMHLDRRDSQGPAEQFIVSLDTYCDRRTAYVFGVNTAGVRFDRYHPVDDEFWRDYSFNPVWEAQTSINHTNWSAEMRIPFSQLRFTDTENQLWGVNFNRWIPAANEDVFWVFTPKQETGYASYFGNLEGISGIQPSSRIEIMPYMASDGIHTGHINASDPYHDVTDFNGRVGGDMRMGLGPNLSLEATVNPDFGQVEADPAEVNLSAYETFFSEKRPFFIEGSQLFESEGSTFFYSRRIGASPHGNINGDFVDAPNNTSILAATKLTGRLKSGLSLGTIAAVTQREFGRGFDSATATTTRSLIEPLTFYGVTRLQQEFGEDASTAGVIFTGVHRDIPEGDVLESRLHKNAFTGSGEWNLRFNGGKYDFIGNAGFSHVRGDESVITSTQRSSAHYFQRPDASEVSLDSSRTSLTGYQFGMRGGKRSGKHWLWGSGFSFESPELELNDAGILGSANDISLWGHIQYREVTPGSTFRNYYITLEHYKEWNYAGDIQANTMDIWFEPTWLNFWSSYISVSRQFRVTSDSRTRGGPLVGFESGYSWRFGFDNNFTSTFRYGGDATYAIDELGGWLLYGATYVSTRIGTRFQLSAEPRYVSEDQPRQYVTTLSGDVQLADNSTFSYSNGGANTFGSRYIFSRIRRTTLAMEFRANYFFTPDLSLEVYVEPFVATGKFYEHGQTPFPGTIDLSTTGDDGSTIEDNPSGDGTFIIRDSTGAILQELNSNNQSQNIAHGNSNFNYFSFNSNMVLRWEFRPGSSLFLVWQRNRENSEPGYHNARAGDLFETLKGDGQDFFALKVSYWIPVS